MKVRYARVITQIQKLTPEKQTMFNNLRDHFIIEQRENDEHIRELSRIEEEKEKNRQEMLAEMSEKKREMLLKLDLNAPVD